MSRKRVTVEQWINEALSDVDKGKPCSALALVYIKGSGVGTEEIHAKQLEGKTHNPGDLARFFVGKATAFAQDLAGIQTFRLLAFYGTNEPQASFPFTVADGELTGGGEVPYAKHEATANGLLGQLMKHNEAMTSMMHDIVKTITVQCVQREKELRQEVVEAQVIVRDVIFNMRKEAHEWKLNELKFQRDTNERQMMGRAMPSLLNFLTGREVIPESHADSEMLDALALTVQPGMLEQLVAVGIVKQEQAALLAARFAKAVERKKKEMEALKTLPPEEGEGQIQ
jgi:hypothetical protein